MTAYLSQIKSLQDKKVAFLVTQFFPCREKQITEMVEKLSKLF
jgi:hypothetical protein